MGTTPCYIVVWNQVLRSWTNNTTAAWTVRKNYISHTTACSHVDRDSHSIWGLRHSNIFLSQLSRLASAHVIVLDLTFQSDQFLPYYAECLIFFLNKMHYYATLMMEWHWTQIGYKYSFNQSSFTALSLNLGWGVLEPIQLTVGESRVHPGQVRLVIRKAVKDFRPGHLNKSLTSNEPSFFLSYARTVRSVMMLTKGFYW